MQYGVPTAHRTRIGWPPPLDRGCITLAWSPPLLELMTNPETPNSTAGVLLAVSARVGQPMLLRRRRCRPPESKPARR